MTKKKGKEEKHNSLLGTKRSATISKETPYLSHQDGFNGSLGACRKVTTRAALLPCLGPNADLCCAWCFSAISALHQHAARHSSSTRSTAELRGADFIVTSSNPQNHTDPPHALVLTIFFYGLSQPQRKLAGRFAIYFTDSAQHHVLRPVTPCQVALKLCAQCTAGGSCLPVELLEKTCN